MAVTTKHAEQAPTSRKAQIKVAAGILLAGLIAFGLYQLFGYWTDRPPSPGDAKKKIADFLEKQTGKTSFQASYPAGLLEEKIFLTPTKGNEAGDRKRRRESDRPQPLTSFKEFRKRMDGAADYKTIYNVIGEELAIAEKLAQAPEPQHKQLSVYVALEAANAALEKAVSPWLASRITEAYLWPGLAVAESGEIRGLTPETILQFAERSFRQADETNNVVQNYKLALKLSAQPQRSDMARFRLAGVYEEMGKYDQALVYLKQVQNTNNANVKRRIAALETLARQ